VILERIEVKPFLRNGEWVKRRQGGVRKSGYQKIRMKDIRKSGYQIGNLGILGIYPSPLQMGWV
jgi:hypothetical protein